MADSASTNGHKKPSGKVRVAIVGAGNCASALVQGVHYYRDAKPREFVPGLMHVDLGGYHISDIEFTAAFDVDGAFWSHRGEKCTFDTMVEEFGLARIDALARLATIVRGADTARPDIAPQAAGLLAASLGLSRMYSDDLEQIDAGMLIYDALYRWCRDAVDETHDWVSHKPRQARQPVRV